ncbi:hypothetical protein PRK78_005518 [Emydomyces testavorans]|uniref:F-box domain-containing protein n=1 Tax=Emydomyces testavorans TaxID=2070801 RepID=A0AAF0DKP5_9EURO|nr:hypothetical protein PRK78_005518 [Emydomyces testavorans]
MADILQELEIATSCTTPEITISGPLNIVSAYSSSNTEAGDESHQYNEQHDGDKIGTKADLADESNPPYLSVKGQLNTQKESETSNAFDSEKRKDIKKGLTLVSLFKRLSVTGKQSQELQLVEKDASRTGCKIVCMSVDIMLEILDHLDFTDREVLRYTCRAFYYGLPALNIRPELHGQCMIARIFRRLYNTSLLPNVREGNQLLTKAEVRDKLERQTQCVFCTNIWPRGSQLHCPFHTPLEYCAPQPPSGLKRLTEFLSPSRIRWAMALRGELTPQTQAEFIARDLQSSSNRRRSRQVGGIPCRFVGSWAEFLLAREWVRWDGGTYFGNAANPKTAGKTKKRFAKVEPELTKLYCCNHCYNVLPDNDSSRLCARCDCAFCGWTGIDLVRVVGRDNRVRYVPLGILVKDAEGKDKEGKKVANKKGKSPEE